MSDAPVTLPYSTDAEQAVLGGLMLDNDRQDEVFPLLRETDFGLAPHRHIYRAMMQLAARQQPIDLITLTEAMESEGVLERVGGFAYLAELSKNTPSAANILAYTGIVAERSRLRGLLLLGRELSAEAASPRADATVLTERTEQRLFQLAEQTQATQNLSLNDGLTAVVSYLESVNGGNGITGTPTGFARLDEMTCGLQSGDLILLAARPSMGKTAFALSCYTAALRGTVQPAFFFSLEMPRSQLLQRLIAVEGRIELSVLRSGRLTDEHWGRVSQAMK